MRTSDPVKSMLRDIAAGGDQVEPSRWLALWAYLIESGTSEATAEAFFAELRRLAASSGSNTLNVRASEGRRAYLHGQEDPAAALGILRSNGYHNAIRKLRPIKGRHRVPDIRALRKEIFTLVESMDVLELTAALETLQASIHSSRRR